MKEYGGYIELEYFHGKEYHEGAIGLNSGRHCLEYLIRARKIKKLLLPRFLCSSVENICRKTGAEVAYYPIGGDLAPVFDGVCRDGTWIYIVNYYGQLPDNRILEMKRMYGNVILDNAQAFFRKPLPGIDTIYTCRKFFGVADGGYVYTDAALEELLERDVSYNRMEFLLGRMEKGANVFYAQYAANNKLFADQSLKRMSLLTQNLLRGIDYERAERVRRENFSQLHTAFASRNQLALTVPEGAYMYPLYLENGAAVRKQLQEKKIYVPTLWPDVFSLCQERELEYDLAANILPLPVDQRYGPEDMEYLIREVECCMK